jgi:hypothetical protein
MIDPIIEKAKSLVRYDAESGKLFWLLRTPSMFNDKKYSAERQCSAWNAKFAGTEAFVARRNGYLAGKLDGQQCYAHRLIWAMHYKEWPEQVDHINGIRDDNRIENLRNVTHGENAKNRRLSSNNRSGINGVCWSKASRKWVANISINGARIHLGTFADIEKAHAVRRVAERSGGFHSNHGKPAIPQESSQ